jgi:hypothetical protein
VSMLGVLILSVCKSQATLLVVRRWCSTAGAQDGQTSSRDASLELAAAVVSLAR